MSGKVHFQLSFTACDFPSNWNDTWYLEGSRTLSGSEIAINRHRFGSEGTCHSVVEETKKYIVYNQ